MPDTAHSFSSFTSSLNSWVFLCGNTKSEPIFPSYCPMYGPRNPVAPKIVARIPEMLFIYLWS